MKNVEYVTTSGIFTNYIYKAIPLAFDQSMSYYETLAGVLNLLKNSVIPAINNNAELLEELEDYVKHYFDNLDVQEEINNKLDDMAESGQLTDIIAQYLQLAGVLAFDTVADMVSAENLVNGSICRTLGKTTYNDGYGSYFKIRTVTSGDVVDNDFIIALNVSNTLIAERIIEKDKPRKVIILGDSYANRENSWADRFRTKMGLTDSNSIIKKVSGTGFYATVDGKNFSTMVVDNIPFNANEITDIIVCGGYNDKNASDSNLSTAFATFVNTCKTNYPNAKIYVGFIGWVRPEIDTVGQSGDYSIIVGDLSYTKNRYINLCSNYSNVKYLNNVEYALHNINDIDSSYFHPTSNGQEKLSEFIKQAYETGSCNYNSQQINITSSFTTPSHITNFAGGFYTCIENNISRIFTNNELYLGFDETTSFTLSGDINIGSLLNGYVQGRGACITSCEVSALIKTKNNGYFYVPATVFITEGMLKIKPKTLNRTGNGWITDSLSYIQINHLNLSCDSMLQY